MSDPTASRVCVAQIGAPHGVRGEVRLFAFTEDPASVADYGPLESEDGGRLFELQMVRPAKGHLVARLAGIDDRDAAEQLRNLRLYVPRDRLPAPAEDEFYHADLIGLLALDRVGSPVGTIVAVQNFGGGDLLEIRPQEGANTFLMQFSKTAVPEVDIAGRKVVIDPPEGVLPPPGDEASEPSP